MVTVKLSHEKPKKKGCYNHLNNVAKNQNEKKTINL